MTKTIQNYSNHLWMLLLIIGTLSNLSSCKPEDDNTDSAQVMRFNLINHSDYDIKIKLYQNLGNFMFDTTYGLAVNDGLVQDIGIFTGITGTIIEGDSCEMLFNDERSSFFIKYEPEPISPFNIMNPQNYSSLEPTEPKVSQSYYYEITNSDFENAEEIN